MAVILGIVPDVVWRLLFDAVVGLGLVVGLFLVREAVGLFRDVARVALTRTTEVRNFPTAGGGHVEVRGTVEAAGETLTDPVTGSEAVAYEYEVTEEERHKDDLSDYTKYGYRHVDEGGVGVPFYVDDGTGRVRVEPGDPDRSPALDHSPVTLYAPGGDSYHADGGESPPGGDGLFDHTTVDLPGTRRRVYETAPIEPGDPVYVLGAPARTGGDPVVRAGDGRFVVAGASQLRTVLFGSGVGLAKTLAGLALVAGCGLWLWVELAHFLGVPGPPSVLPLPWVGTPLALR